MDVMFELAIIWAGVYIAVIAAAIVLAEGVAKPAQLGGGSEPQRPSE